MSVPKNLAITFDKPALDKAAEEIEFATQRDKDLIELAMKVVDPIKEENQRKCTVDNTETQEEEMKRVQKALGITQEDRIDTAVERAFPPGTSPSHGNVEVVRQKGMGDETLNVKSTIRDGGNYQRK